MVEYIKEDYNLVSVGSFLSEECTRLQHMLEEKGVVCHAFSSEHGNLAWYDSYSITQLSIQKSDVEKALPIVDEFKRSLK